MLDISHFLKKVAPKLETSSPTSISTLVKRSQVTLKEFLRSKPKLDQVVIRKSQVSEETPTLTPPPTSSVPIKSHAISPRPMMTATTSTSTTITSRVPIKLVGYCDGSTYKNGSKHASGGIGIYFGHNDPKNVSEPFLDSVPNNQKTELLAMTRAIEIFNHEIDHNPQSRYHCELYSDSQYAINSLLKWSPQWVKSNWKGAKGQPIKHIDLQKRLISAYQPHRQQIHIHHINAHTGKNDIHSQGNAQADQLAKLGSQQHPNYHHAQKI